MGLPAMALFGQTHILHDCATAAHELPASSNHPVPWVYFTGWSIICTRVPTGTLSNRYLISSLRRRIQPLTYPEPNTKIGIGTVDGIQPANINRVQPHGIIGPRRNKCGQTLPSFRIFAPGVRRWRPCWCFCLRSTVVTQLRGVSRPARPIPIGKTSTVLLSGG